MSDRRGLSEGVAVLVSAVVGLVVATASVWFVSGYNIFYEKLFRIQPTVAGGGVGTDFVLGNGTFGWLITLIHLADVVMGLFILLIVFIHWGAFRRLAARMQQPGHTAEDGRVAADGGRQEGERRDDVADSGGDPQ